MKKLLAVLLGMVFAVNLLLLLSIVGECGSPRRALYTITDGMMNSIYRFRNGRNIRKIETELTVDLTVSSVFCQSAQFMLT